MCSKWLIIWTLVAAAGCRDCGPRPPGTRGLPPTTEPYSDDVDGDTETTACPVCGLEMKKKEAAFHHEHDQKTYHFFLEDHKDAFALDPEAYLPASTDTQTVKKDAAQKKQRHP